MGQCLLGQKRPTSTAANMRRQPSIPLRGLNKMGHCRKPRRQTQFQLRQLMLWVAATALLIKLGPYMPSPLPIVEALMVTFVLAFPTLAYREILWRSSAPEIHGYHATLAHGMLFAGLLLSIAVSFGTLVVLAVWTEWPHG